MKASFAFLAVLAVSVSAQTPPWLGNLLIKPGSSNTKCIGPVSNTNGAKVTLAPCTGAANQLWKFEGGAVKIYGNKCLDVIGNSLVKGTRVEIRTCVSGKASQKYDYNHWIKQLRVTNTNVCLDLPKGILDNGSEIALWDCKNTNGPNQVWDAGYTVDTLIDKTQPNQYGTNLCPGQNVKGKNCQTAYLNSAEDFCLFAPPTLGTVGANEHKAVAFCTKHHGARPVPNGTIKGHRFIVTDAYVQLTGVGNLTKINVPIGDYGGELDNRGATGYGNPAGGVVFSNAHGSVAQYHEWTSFISDREFCFRACRGSDSPRLCNHIYDTLGCWWNIPGVYSAGQYQQCKGDVGPPMGVYGTSTYTHRPGATPPPAHPPAKTSSCVSVPSPNTSTLVARHHHNDRMMKRVAAPFPGPTPAP